MIRRLMLTATCAAAMLVLFTTAQARNTVLRLPIADALGTADAKSRLTGNVKFFFGAENQPTPAKTMGSARTNKKTNFFNKSDKEGCEWAFLSAMLSFQERALADGGDAIIKIKSITNTEELSSATEYLCRAGNVVGGVAFVGEVVKL